MIGALALANAVQQPACVGCAVGDGHLDVHTGHLYGGFLDALQAPHGGIFNGLQILALQHVRHGAQRRLHHAAGDAEDHRRAGGVAQHIVEGLIRQVYIIDGRLADHAGQLTGGDIGVHIPVAVPAHFRPGDLELLGGTGHDGHHENVLGIQAVFLRKVGLGDGALHLVGALAAGQVGNEILMEMLAILDPARAAGGDHGQHAALLDPLDELRAFLHNGQVSAEVHVEYPVRAQPAQGGGQLAGGAGADGHAKFFANGHPHGRRRLKYHKLGRIP